MYYGFKIDSDNEIEDISIDGSIIENRGGVVNLCGTVPGSIELKPIEYTGPNIFSGKGWLVEKHRRRHPPY